jgi:DNA helicase HerA-like ATPase
MDPAVIDLTTKVMVVLLPFVSKGAEEFASKVGDATYEKAKTLLTTLKHKWSGDKEATETLEHFEQKPERYKGVLEDILKEKLSEDKDLAVTVARLLQEKGPTVKIIQKLEEMEDSTAVEVERMKSGNMDVNQDAKNIKRGKLVDFGEIGG